LFLWVRAAVVLATRADCFRWLCSHSEDIGSIEERHRGNGCTAGDLTRPA
jgi:hypothetical protein